MKKVNLIAAVLLSALSMSAQEKTLINPSTNYRVFGLSLESGHYYDIAFTSFDDLQNGASGEDMRGLNGPGTKFDVGFGFRASYYYSPLVSFDFAYDRAEVTGANSVETHISKNEAFTLGANFNFKRADRTEQYKIVPFARLGVGVLNFDSQRYFVSDGIEFSNRIGATTHTETGLGVQMHITDAFSVRAQSILRIVYSDAWDGYDYSSGRDHMLKTTVGLEYAFGQGRHKNTLPAFRDTRVAQLAARVDALQSSEEAMLKMLAENTAVQTKLQEDLKAMQEGVEALAEKQASFEEQLKDNSEISSYNIYYQFNETQPAASFVSELQERVFALAGKDVVFVIKAYSDPKGTKLQNALVRNRRTANVKKLLRSWGISEDAIEIAKWDGTHTGNDRLDRRVEVTPRLK